MPAASFPFRAVSFDRVTLTIRSRAYHQHSKIFWRVPENEVYHLTMISHIERADENIRPWLDEPTLEGATNLRWDIIAYQDSHENR